MADGSGLLLVSAAIGYLVLERSEKHKGGLKRVGRLLGSVIIIVSLIGVACRIWYVSTWTKGAWAGRYCPVMPRAGMSPMPESAPSRSAP